MSEYGMHVVRRYIMDTQPFTIKAPVYGLRIEVVPLACRIWLRVLEIRDTGHNHPLLDLHEYEIHSENVKHSVLVGQGLSALAGALYDEQLRGRLEKDAAHQLFLAIATDTHGFAKAWVHTYLPEWAAWWDKTMALFQAQEKEKEP